MAAKKENHVPTACQAPSIRITRAQSRARLGITSLPQPTKTDQNQAAKGRTKRGPSDQSTSAISGPQPKRRTVLKDVTNTSCANSIRKCIATSKQQTRPSQRGKQVESKYKKCALKIPKVPRPAVNGSSLNDSKVAVENVGPLSLQNVGPLSFQNDGSLSLHDIDRNRDSACHEAFFAERHVREEPQPEESKSGDSPAMDIFDIDKDIVNPQMCAPYVVEIYSHLMASELMRRPSANYMETVQRDITKGMRAILIDWLVEVAEEYKLVPDTLYLTVYLIDRFLSRNYMERHNLQLLGITSMLLASKYEEICAPRVDEFCFITDNTYTKAEVLKMECQVINDLGFHLSVPTTKTFLRRFLRAAQASRKVPSVTLGFLANYLAELTLVDYGFLRFLPSLVAASAVFLARWTLDPSDLPWNRTLEHYTSYKSADIQTCVCALRGLQHNSSNFPLNGIREKYKQEKFECVANLTSPELLQSLFS